MTQNDKYVFFYGTFLSNWYEAPFYVDYVKYVSSEQYFMTKKAIYFQDWDIWAQMMKTDDPAEVKALGRKVKNFNPIDWDMVCEQIMYRGCFEKFNQNADIQKSLLKLSHKKFVEASPYDRIWGIGLGENDTQIFDEKNWKGKNLLGKVLDRVAKELKG